MVINFLIYNKKSELIIWKPLLFIRDNGSYKLKLLFIESIPNRFNNFGYNRCVNKCVRTYF